MPDEVFSWFKDAGFGQVTRRPARISLTVAFVRKILQRYKDIEVYVYPMCDCCSRGSFLVFVCAYYLRKEQPIPET